MTPTARAALALIDVHFALAAGDALVLVSDGAKPGLATALDDACRRRGVAFHAETLVDDDAYELPSAVARRVAGATAALITTRRSYTHTDGVRAAAAGGTRVATNSRLDETQLVHGLLADHGALAERARAYGARLGAARQVTIESGHGAELTFSVAQQRGMAETGLYVTPGDVGNLPAGEAACGIDDGTGEGTLVVDGSWPGLGLLAAPLTLTFAAGAIVRVEGPRAGELEAILDRHGPAARHLAELGLGMNPGLEVQGNTLLDEKVAGTIHVAVGNDVTFGGRNDVGYHADGVIRAPRLRLDGEPVALPTPAAPPTT